MGRSYVNLSQFEAGSNSEWKFRQLRDMENLNQRFETLQWFQTLGMTERGRQGRLAFEQGIIQWKRT